MISKLQKRKVKSFQNIEFRHLNKLPGVYLFVYI